MDIMTVWIGIGAVGIVCIGIGTLMTGIGTIITLTSQKKSYMEIIERIDKVAQKIEEKNIDKSAKKDKKRGSEKKSKK